MNTDQQAAMVALRFQVSLTPNFHLGADRDKH